MARDSDPKSAKSKATGQNTQKFSSPWDYMHFQERLRSGHRFFRPPKDRLFFSALGRTAKNRAEILPKGRSFARAQLGCDIEEECVDESLSVEHERPFTLERMKPLPRSKTAGRLQPIGKSVLYLATDIKTAIAEVRPWVGAPVSVARFEISRDLKIVDCRDDKDFLNLRLDDQYTDEELEKGIWSWINRDLALPVDPSDPHINYLHTQVIGEFLHTEGYDGVAFKSSLNPAGTNLALFDLNAATPVSRTLFKVTGVSFESEKYVE